MLFRTHRTGEIYTRQMKEEFLVKVGEKKRKRNELRSAHVIRDDTLTQQTRQRERHNLAGCCYVHAAFMYMVACSTNYVCHVAFGLGCVLYVF